MAYAMIASLPPIIGLYTGSIAPFIFALLGTSRQLSVGPVALVSQPLVALTSLLEL
jgi:SulP family sulfate permease